MGISKLSHVGHLVRGSSKVLISFFQLQSRKVMVFFFFLLRLLRHSLTFHGNLNPFLILGF